MSLPNPPLPRDEFPASERYCYLNHAGIGPPSRAAIDAMTRDGDDASRRGSLSEDDRQVRAEQIRAAAATLMGVPNDDVSFVKNTTEGLAFVANGIDWRRGDRVLVPDLEFPSTLFPWLEVADRWKVEVDLVTPRGPGRVLDLDRFADALEAGAGRTRVVALSWIQFVTGWRTDLAALADLCHRHGARLCADVIQGLGVVPADLAAWGVDAAMADAHKWMLGPEGTGVLYVASDWRPSLRVSEPGWASVAHRMEWDNLDLVYAEDARRYEGGTANLAGIAGMGASLDLLAGAGQESVWGYVDGLCDRLVAGLGRLGAGIVSDRSPGGRSGIVTFTVPGVAPEAAVERLLAAGVVGSPRGPGIRFSPHAWNTTEDIDRALDAVAALPAG